MPNLKIKIKEQDFLRKTILEKYQQKAPTWSPVGSPNKYTNIATNIEKSAKKQNSSVSVSHFQMHKLFNSNGEFDCREDFIEACYLYCGLNRNIHGIYKEDKRSSSTEDDTLMLQQDVEYFKNLWQESENRIETLQKEMDDTILQAFKNQADALQKEIDHHAEQKSQLEFLLETQQTEMAAVKTQLKEKEDWIEVLNRKVLAQKEQNESLDRKITAQNEQNESLDRKITAQNEHNESLKSDLGTHQNQLWTLKTKLVEQEKALHHYVSLLKSYKAIIEHHKVVSEAELKNLKQTIVALNDENKRLAMEKTVLKKTKKTFAKILSIM
jgi:chromosome segregation ATPase